MSVIKHVFISVSLGIISCATIVLADTQAEPSSQNTEATGDPAVELEQAEHEYIRAMLNVLVSYYKTEDADADSLPHDAKRIRRAMLATDGQLNAEILAQETINSGELKALASDLTQHEQLAKFYITLLGSIYENAHAVYESIEVPDNGVTMAEIRTPPGYPFGIDPKYIENPEERAEYQKQYQLAKKHQRLLNDKAEKKIELNRTKQLVQQELNIYLFGLNISQRKYVIDNYINTNGFPSEQLEINPELMP